MASHKDIITLFSFIGRPHRCVEDTLFHLVGGLKRIRITEGQVRASALHHGMLIRMKMELVL